jgi:hypothetical protein
MRKSNLETAKATIIKYLEGIPHNVFQYSQLREIFSNNRHIWKIPKSIGIHKFITFLLSNSILLPIKLPLSYLNEIRYIRGNASLGEILLSLRPSSYFSHYSAMYINELTHQIPKTIYVNVEQPPKRSRDSTLTQEKIDVAFRHSVRISKNSTSYGGYKICLLNGMHTGNLGVIEMPAFDYPNAKVTNIERTLIDISVRPAYSGGIFEVLNAYRLAEGRVSINKLNAYLKKINYIYPYHQVVGFYLEKAGVYKESLIELIGNFEIKNDFYLTHQMKDTEYSSKWRLFFPKGF